MRDSISLLKFDFKDNDSSILRLKYQTRKIKTVLECLPYNPRKEHTNQAELHHFKKQLMIRRSPFVFT